MTEFPTEVALLSVCPHDTAKNQIGWYTLNTYLQRKLSARIHFEPQDDFLKERALVLAKSHHLVYANPFSAAIFARELGFICVARPIDVFDESLIVAQPAFDLAQAQRPVQVATATDKLITTPLGLEALRHIGLNDADIQLRFVGNHMNAIKAVLDGSAALGIVFNETWAGASAMTRAALKVITESHERKASHCFMVSPAWADRAAEVQRLLCTMHDEPAGQRILDDLKFTGFEAMSQADLDTLRQYVSA